MGGWKVAAGVLLCCALALALAAPVEASHFVQSRRYVLGVGGSATGPWICMGEIPGFDIGAACNLICPHDPCTVRLYDDVRGYDTHYRICVDGEEFCRPGGDSGTVQIRIQPGTTITVVPDALEGTKGTVYVR